MTPGVVVATVLAAVALVTAATWWVRRRRPPAPVLDPREAPFSLAQVAREAREHGAAAGRAAAQGAPVAHRPDDLPGRRWVAERLEEQVAARRAELATALRAAEEELVAVDADLARRRGAQEALAAAVARLEVLHEEDAERPRVEQDVRLADRLAAARRELAEAQDACDALALRAAQLRARREHAPGETEAQVALLREAVPALAAEHDLAFAAARLQAPAAPAALPAPARLPEPLGLDEITARARREAGLAGLAAARGDATIGTAEGLPSHDWVLERFGEHLAAARARHAQARRGLVEAIAEQDERCREAERALAAAQGALARLDEEAQDGPEAARRAHGRAERAVRAEATRLHEARLVRETLAAREGQLDVELDEHLALLQDAQVAAVAEHRLVFERSRRPVAPPRWGGFAGPEHPGAFPPPTPDPAQAESA